uniref:Fucosyltransferase n=1 Tax=Ananas comosus var. bracteatus TaxID=296719 RepID=A0A6V7Q109_ANACO|nr:unnamed protein product [Ananas comosus var. bracteatus]
MSSTKPSSSPTPPPPPPPPFSSFFTANSAAAAVFASRRVSCIAPLVVAALFAAALVALLLDFPKLSPSLLVDSPAVDSSVVVTTAVDSLGSRQKERFGDVVPHTGGGTRRGVTWVPDILDGVYECRCGLSCVWSRNVAVVDEVDVTLWESFKPPKTRKQGEPLRAFMDLEATRRPSGFEDIFIGYHAKDDVQATYAGKTFRITRSYRVAKEKKNDTLVYWSSSRCLPHRDALAKALISLIPTHSFGRCLNNVGGSDVALDFFPIARWKRTQSPTVDHLHCAMSHYKFVLAIENTNTESYVTEKLFYALDAGSVPIYFGTSNVWDFVPPNSIIEGSKFSSLEELASYVKALAEDPWPTRSTMRGGGAVCWETTARPA